MPSEFIVHHILAETPGALTEILEKQLSLKPDFTLKLLRLGSIWANYERRRENIPIEPGWYIRVHQQPRRFPTQEIDWRSTIVFEDEDMLVINKPAGIPVHASVDNYVENVIYCLSETLGIPLYITQRLDTGTSGILLLAKTKWFQGQFNKLLRERLTQKTYLARVPIALNQGELIHYMQPTPHAPKIVSQTPTEGWQECRLIIKKIKPVSKNSFDTEIELLTGRTHQIRAQLSSLQAPIHGDSLYGSTAQNPWAPKTYKTDDSIALVSYSLEFMHPSKQNRMRFEHPIAFNRRMFYPKTHMKFLSIIFLLAMMAWSWQGYKVQTDVPAVAHVLLQQELKSFITDYLQKNVKGLINIKFQRFWTETTTSDNIKAVFEYSFDVSDDKAELITTQLTGSATLTPLQDADGWSLDRIEINNQVLEFKNGALIGPDTQGTSEQNSNSNESK